MDLCSRAASVVADLADTKHVVEPEDEAADKVEWLWRERRGAQPQDRLVPASCAGEGAQRFALVREGEKL